MPRKKVEMKLIEDLKKRKTTFKNRSDGLIAKTMQLSILCGCDALFICYDPTAAASVKTWPEEPEKVRKLIRKYRDVPADRFRQVLTPLTFNEGELKKEQGRVIKVQQCGAAELSAWDRCFDNASAAHINSELGKLDETMQRVQQRMAALGGINHMIVPASSADAAVVAAPRPHAMSLPVDNAFNFGSGSFSSETSASMVTTQYYELPHGHQMLQPFPFQPVCHGGYQMPPPLLSYQMLPPSSLPYLSYQMPTEFDPTGGYATNVANGASATSEFYDGFMQGFDASGGGGGGMYVSEDVLGQAFSSARPPSGVYHFAQQAAAGVWPVVSLTNDPMDHDAAFQPRNDFSGQLGSGSCTSSTSYQGGFEN